MDWFEQAFGGFAEMAPWAIAVVVALIALGVVLLVLYVRMKRRPRGEGAVKKQWTTKEIATAALCISGAFILSFIKIFSMPMGGSITPASMLPIMAFAYIYGVRKGLLAGLVYSFLQMIQDPFILSLPQVLLDYTGAFTLLALAGLAKKNIIPGIAIACAARFLCQFTSGIVFFGMYAPEGMPAWLYSLGYSGSVVGVECAVCIGVALIPAMGKMLDRAKAQNAGLQKAVIQQRTA